MKISKYTFLFEIGNKNYAYNTLSNALIELDNKSFSLLRRDEKNDQVSNDDYEDELLKALIDNIIITDNDTDDFLKYKACIMQIRSQRTNMHLTLAPTMDCCFRCHYCFEKYKEKTYMKPKVMDNIIKYVTSCPNLKDIKITWFGGEPLMAVSQIEKFYKKFSSAWNNPIDSNIITTGYHINDESIQVMKNVGISAAQITLDGIKETHNRVKYLNKGEDVFGKVINNIALLNDKAPDISIMIRVNLTMDNAHEYELLNKYICEVFQGRKNIGIAPAFVLDRGISNCDNCTLFNHKDRSDFILNLAKKDIDSPFVHYPQRFLYECAIRNKMAIAFDPKGYAYKCWEVIGNKEYAIGKLNDEGQLTDINEKILNRQLYGADPLDDPTCSQCKYLPICNGGCPIQRIENKFEGGRNSVCSYYKGYMVEFLKIHLARKKAGFENY